MKRTIILIISLILCFSFLSGCDESYTYLSTKPTEEQVMPDITDIIGKDDNIISDNISGIIDKITEEPVYQYSYITCIVNGLASSDTIYVTPDNMYTGELGTVVAVKMNGIWNLGLDMDERIRVKVKGIEYGSPITIIASDIVSLGMDSANENE